VIHDLLALHKRAHHRPSTNGDADMEHHARMPKPVLEPQLSQREAEVAILLCQGCINKEVADKLNISLTTVITHRKNIMDKLGARSLADVIIYCVMNGLYHV
jgi:DNA-binding NarL/FixJ family response regulator